MSDESVYLLRVDLSEILSHSNESIYTIMIDNAEFSLICEIKQWIQILFGIKDEINLKYKNTMLHDNESVRIIPHLTDNLQVTRKTEASSFFCILQKNAIYNNAPVYPSILKKMNSLIGAPFITPPADISINKLTSPYKNPPICFDDQILTTVNNECSEFPAPSSQPHSQVEIIQTEEDSVTKCKKVRLNQQQSDTNQVDNSTADSAPIQRRPRAFDIGHFMNILKNECQETPTDSTPSPLHEEITQSREDSNSKRKRVRRHRRKANKNVGLLYNSTLDTDLPSGFIHQEVDVKAFGNKHVRFSDSDMTSQDDTHETASSPQTPLIKKLTGVPPVFVIPSPTNSVKNGEVF